MKKLFSLLILVAMSSCSSVLECALNDPPYWEDRTLPDGMRFQSYNQSVFLYRASDFQIENFRLSGDLPQGLDYNFYGDDVVISGTPTQNGTFRFKLKVKVQYVDADGNSESCSSTIEKNYSIKIN
ncbi:hypothetical protein [Flavobacterium sp.]|uniref:hypothetical protein n=1 Tax=Flavobacterium sp. TaxID=239 RepID=UPI001209CD52|nr:hypothetical protein [Flavobacterium sp.]RZJ69081.1 MAG: hypothetical protein EOO49_18725 [Flavobacterium sp.]